MPDDQQAVVWEIDYRAMTIGPERRCTYVAARTKKEALDEWTDLQGIVEGDVIETLSVEPLRDEEDDA